eukprot:CAMPEP_0170499346 /NCGR_PEP_ID=MMETSP0208-20121228/31062_1 /TAXON_ID=197538 /ORGANISM="Strombidium inclinatum, Strain S3" /LENGTH=46 /DNA_ID= /DNA_START= /DNA_END= /DNA_ORIENTATION=
MVTDLLEDLGHVEFLLKLGLAGQVEVVELLVFNAAKAEAAEELLPK